MIMSNMPRWFVNTTITLTILFLISLIIAPTCYEAKKTKWQKQNDLLTTQHIADSTIIDGLETSIAVQKSTIEAADKEIAQAKIDDSLKNVQIQKLNGAVYSLKIENGSAKDSIAMFVDSTKSYTIKSSLLADSVTAYQRLLTGANDRITLMQNTLCQSDSAYQAALALLKKPVKFLLIKKYPKLPAVIYQLPANLIENCQHVIQMKEDQINADEAKKAKEAKQSEKVRSGHHHRK